MQSGGHAPPWRRCVQEKKKHLNVSCFLRTREHEAIEQWDTMKYASISYFVLINFDLLIAY